MKNLFPKSYFSLEEVAERWSAFADGEVSSKDILQLGAEGKLVLSVRMSRGHRWRVLDERDEWGTPKLERLDIERDTVLNVRHFVDLMHGYDELRERGATRIFQDNDGFLYSETQRQKGEPGWHRDHAQELKWFRSCHIVPERPYLGALEETIGVEVTESQVIIRSEEMLRFEREWLRTQELSGKDGARHDDASSKADIGRRERPKFLAVIKALAMECRIPLDKTTKAEELVRHIAEVHNVKVPTGKGPIDKIFQEIRDELEG